MVDVEKAKKLLFDDRTCIFIKDNKEYISNLKGIAPLFSMIEELDDTSGYSVADKIVGKAAAMIFVKMGIKEVYGEVMSLSGKQILEQYNIPYSYNTLVSKIINRKGDDICPMEKTVIDIDDLDVAYKLLKNKNELLNK